MTVPVEGSINSDIPNQDHFFFNISDKPRGIDEKNNNNDKVHQLAAV